LDGIFRVLAVMEETVRDSEHLTLMSLYKFSERREAALLCVLYQRQIVVGRHERSILLHDCRGRHRFHPVGIARSHFCVIRSVTTFRRIS
jgi:hypothetical protein